MLNDSITLNDGNADTVFDLISRTGTRSVRQNSAKTVQEPEQFVVSHETTSSGRVNTVAYVESSLFTDTIPDGSSNRTQFKISYNPRQGRVDQEADLLHQIALIKDLLSDPNIVAKLLNKES